MLITHKINSTGKEYKILETDRSSRDRFMSTHNIKYFSKRNFKKYSLDFLIKENYDMHEFKSVLIDVNVIDNVLRTHYDYEFIPEDIYANDKTSVTLYTFIVLINIIISDSEEDEKKIRELLNSNLLYFDFNRNALDFISNNLSFNLDDDTRELIQRLKFSITNITVENLLNNINRVNESTINYIFDNKCVTLDDIYELNEKDRDKVIKKIMKISSNTTGIVFEYFNELNDKSLYRDIICNIKLSDKVHNKEYDYLEYSIMYLRKLVPYLIKNNRYISKMIDEPNYLHRIGELMKKYKIKAKITNKINLLGSLDEF